MEQLEAIEGEIELLCSRLSAEEVAQNPETTKIEKIDDKSELVHHGEFVEIRELETDDDVKPITRNPVQKERPVKENLDEILDDVFREWDDLERQEIQDENSKPKIKIVTEQSIDNPGDIFSTIHYKPVCAS